METQLLLKAPINRKKRSLGDTMLGGTGTGLGVLNSIDEEVLAHQLNAVGQHLGALSKS